MKTWTFVDAMTLCRQLEKKLRPRGWHIALTGSVLYGMGKNGDVPCDLDVILYPNNDNQSHDEIDADLMEICGVKEYRVMGLGDYSRDVIKATTAGRTVDFFILE